jgi:phage terminase large subunit-like protein
VRWPPVFPEPRVRYEPVADSRWGRAAAGLAALAGVDLEGWQRRVLDAGCDRRGGLWSAFEVGLIVPRQNGKSVVLAVRALAGALVFGERLIIVSSHEWRTVVEQFTATLELVEGSPLRRYVRRVRRTGGEESITFTNGARIRFMNRSRESARGFSADAVILDEAHALTAEQAGALLPVLSARKDAQLWYAAHGPAPGAWQLARLRNRALSESPGRLCWLEWSADPSDDLEDPAVWAACNPAEAAGRLSLERMAEERATLGRMGFAAERLAAAPWPSEFDNAWTVFTEADWLAMIGSDAP